MGEEPNGVSDASKSPSPIRRGPRARSRARLYSDLTQSCEFIKCHHDAKCCPAQVPRTQNLSVLPAVIIVYMFLHVFQRRYCCSTCYRPLAVQSVAPSGRGKARQRLPVNDAIVLFMYISSWEILRWPREIITRCHFQSEFRVLNT